jgi:Polyketide cyclase / dehydrase and lipid transport
LCGGVGRPYRYTDVRQVAVDPGAAWSIVSDHEYMSEWTPARAVVLENLGRPDPNGVGAVRALHMWGPTIRERITAFEPPTRLEYELVSGLPFRDYTGQIIIGPSGNGSVITTTISFRTILPGTQLLVALAIRVASAGAARAAQR